MGGKTSVLVDTTDSNGFINDFYLDFMNDGQSVEHQNQLLFQPTLIPNFAYKYSYWVKDDDSLQSNKLVFWVYPDQGPDSIVASYSDGQLKFSWSGMDYKDSLQTEYRILVHRSGDDGYNQPDSSNSADIAKNWTAGSATEFNYTAGANKPFSWEYTPTDCQSGQTCTYYYQIEARDARGSVARGTFSLGTFDYTAP